MHRHFNFSTFSGTQRRLAGVVQIESDLSPILVTRVEEEEKEEERKKMKKKRGNEEEERDAEWNQRGEITSKICE